MRNARLALALVAVAACSSFDAAESTTADGGALDGGADATSDGGLVPCSARSVKDPAHFCDDFDRPGNLAYGWIPRVTDGGAIEETDAALSAPRALVGHLGASSSNQDTYALLGHRMPSAFAPSGKNQIGVSFALRIDHPPYPASANGVAMLASIRFDDAECNTSGPTKLRSLAVTIHTDGLLAFEAKGFQGICADAGRGDDFLFTALPFRLADLTRNGFHRISFEIAHGGCAKEPDRSSALVRIDGVPSECTTLVVDPFTKLVDFEVQLGPGAFGGPFAETVFVYDDVSVDFD